MGLPLTSPGKGEAVVVATVGILDAKDSRMVTFFVVDVSNHKGTEVEADAEVVEGVTPYIWVDNAGTVEEAARSLSIIAKVFPVVPVCVSLLVVKDVTSLNGCVVFGEINVVEDAGSVSRGGKVGTGEADVELVLGLSGKIIGTVAIPSKGVPVAFLLVSV